MDFRAHVRGRGSYAPYLGRRALEGVRDGEGDRLYLNVFSPAFAAAVFVGTVLMCLVAAKLPFKRVAGIDPALVFRT